MPSSATLVSGTVIEAGTSVGIHAEQGQVVVVAVASARTAVVENPFRDAVSRAVCAAEMVPARAVKVAVVEDGETTTDAGAVRSPVSLDKLTERPPPEEAKPPGVEPPAGVAALKVTVHVLLPPELSVVGAQTSEVTVITGGARLREAVCELLFNVAVMTAV